jgi:hypothetical protein
VQCSAVQLQLQCICPYVWWGRGGSSPDHTELIGSRHLVSTQTIHVVTRSPQAVRVPGGEPGGLLRAGEGLGPDMDLHAQLSPEVSRSSACTITHLSS